MEEARTYKREKYLHLTKELRNAGYRAVEMPVEVGSRGFIGSSVYDLLPDYQYVATKEQKL